MKDKMPTCAVKGCSINDAKIRKEKLNVGMHSFPKDEFCREQWLKACKAENINLKCARICSLHFRPECYQPMSWVQEQVDPKKFQRLFPGAVPTEHLPSDENAIIEEPTSSMTQNLAEEIEDLPKIVLMQNEENIALREALDEQAREYQKIIEELEDHIQRNRQRWRKTKYSLKLGINKCEPCSDTESPAVYEKTEDESSETESSFCFLNEDDSVGKKDWRSMYLKEKKKNDSLRKQIADKNQELFEEKKNVAEALMEYASLKSEICKWKSGCQFYKRKAESVEIEKQLLMSEEAGCSKKFK